MRGGKQMNTIVLCCYIIPFIQRTSSILHDVIYCSKIKPFSGYWDSSGIPAARHHLPFHLYHYPPFDWQLACGRYAAGSSTLPSLRVGGWWTRKSWRCCQSDCAWGIVFLTFVWQIKPTIRYEEEKVSVPAQIGMDWHLVWWLPVLRGDRETLRTRRRSWGGGGIKPLWLGCGEISPFCTLACKPQNIKSRT